MAESTAVNMLLIGSGFLVIACIFFIMIGFVAAVDVPKAQNIFQSLDALYGNSVAETAQEPVAIAIDPSFVWIILLGLSLVIVLIGTKLVFDSYEARK